MKFCTGFARDDDASVGGRSFHRLIRGLGDGKDVRWPLVHLPTFVLVDHTLVVNTA